MNVTEPVSIVHAKAELADARASMTERLEAKKQGKFVDNEQLRMDQLRIAFLKDWIKSQVSGVAPKCAGCSILAALYEECKDTLPEKWRAAIWKMTHASGLMRVAKKSDEVFLK